VVAALGFGAYLTLALRDWRAMEAPSWDLAIFTQAIKGYANFGAPIVDIKGPGSVQLGDHFSPLLVLFAPAYRLFPSPATLLVAQCLLVAVSAAPIAGLARRLIGPEAALCLATAYVLSWGLQTGVKSQFHEYCLAAPLLAMALVWLVEGHWRAAAWCSALLIGVKEDLGFTACAIGCLMIVLASPPSEGRAGRAFARWWARLRSRGPAPGAQDPPARAAHVGKVAERTGGVIVPPDGRRVGVWLAAGSLVAALLVLAVVVPLFSQAGQWEYWSRLPEPEGSLWARIGSVFVPAEKWRTLGLLVAVVAGVALFSPISLLALPTLAWRFTSPNESYWVTDWHYSMILMPIVFIAAVAVLGRWWRAPRALMRWPARAAPVAMLAVAVALIPSFPLGSLLRPGAFDLPEKVVAAEPVLALIPPGTSVASDYGLISRLAADRTVYWLGQDLGSIAPDYVLIDSLASWNSPPTDPAAYAEGLYGEDYVNIYPTEGPPAASRFRLAARVGRLE
jgi:uncharacterized membrane protein